MPGCERCGQCGCVCGKLPYTLTVTFAGLQNRTHSVYCNLLFTSNFGCGAAAVVTAPGGCDENEEETCGPSNRGGIAGVLVTEPGHDYARLGRVEPTLTITGSGTGATFTPTLEPVDDTLDAQCRSYKLASVEVADGAGYTNGETLNIATNGIMVTPAVATLATGHDAPTITAEAVGGTGAVLAVSLASSGDPPVWGVDAVSVTEAGSGYTDGAAVTFTVAAGDTVLTAAAATISVGGGTPDDCVAVSPVSVTGTGAAFSWTWLPVTDGYEIVPVIDNGGSDYTVGDFFYFEDTCNDDGPAIYVDSVDGNGAITAVSGGGVYVWPPAAGNGGISSVTVTEAGAAFRDTGIPQSVTVDEPGEYYKEDPTAAPCLADVTVSLVNCDQISVQLEGEESATLHPASISATIGDDPDDPTTWGKITGLTIDDAGAGYLSWRWLCLNQAPINDQPIVLVAQNPHKLVTLNIVADYGAGGCVRVVAKGDGMADCDPPFEKFYDGQPGPIREINLVSGGSGYAVPGREEPEWTVYTAGYTFTPVFAEADPDEHDRPRWTVESMSISGPAAGFGATNLDGWKLQQPAAYSPPQPPTSTRITEPVERFEEPYVVVVRTRQQPTVTAAVGGSGSGAAFTVTMAESDGYPKTWRVASVAVNDGGGGYADDEEVTFSVPPRSGSFGHFTVTPATARCRADGDGVITSVSVGTPGAYYLDNGLPQLAEVKSGGLFFREDPTLPPHVANVTVEVGQVPPSNGSGAAIAVTVEDDIADPDFGEIAVATLESGGSGYTILGGPKDCSYQALPCGITGIVVELQLRGRGKQPEITLQDGRVWPGNYTVLRADEGIGDCDELPTTASLLYGAPAGVTATITRGGVVDSPCDWPAWCSPEECLCPSDLVQPETSVTVTSDIPCADGGTAEFSGQWQDIDLACGYRLIPEGEILYDNDIGFSIVCCDRQCDNDEPCELKVYACVDGYAYDPATDTYCPISGCSECVEFDITDGQPSGTITVPVVACSPPDDVEYSMTITIG